jgi:hypothetical protein
MKNAMCGRVGRWGASLLLSGGILVFGFQQYASGAGAEGSMKRPGPNDDLLKLNFKFDGAQSCSNAQCHGADAPKEGKGATTLAEYTQWSGGDKHKDAFGQLSNDQGKKIADALKIADATTDARCTQCHALDVPKNLQGKQYDKSEGVSCASCHGPSEKWLSPHKEKGWTEKQRVQYKTHDALLKATGLFDTKSVIDRANKCTSCHLSIDADMVAAGHPQPTFELDYFSKDDKAGGIYTSQHWRNPNVPFYNASLWSTGQAVSVRDAMHQLADRAGMKADAKAVTDAFNQAMAHYSVFRGTGYTGKWDPTSGMLTKAMTAKDMAGVAKNAQMIADEAGKAAPGVGAAKWDKARTTAVLQYLLKDPTPAYYGDKGMEQQAYAIYSLYNAITPNGPAAKAIVEQLFPPEQGAYDKAKFAAGLKAIAAQVK